MTGANSPNGYFATELPPGLAFNSTNGVISGVPGLAGEFQVSLIASNNLGLGASIVLIQIFDTGSSVVREIWSGISGTNIVNIPLDTPATATNVLGALEGLTDYSDNYGERVRGYLTAPITGNYYFWIAGSDLVELWISNDEEPVNKVKRAWVNPTNNGTASHQWDVQPKQKSGWLSLVAGQRYYVEVLHKAGVGTGDNWSVGWISGLHQHEQRAEFGRSGLPVVALLSPARFTRHRVRFTTPTCLRKAPPPAVVSVRRRCA